MNPKTLRQALNDALSLLSQCEDFLSNARLSDDDSRGAYMTLYNLRLEKLEKKIGHIMAAMTAPL